jgi:acyl-CoA reductase-like NAD-dependent aldehyde dehydrogenase
MSSGFVSAGTTDESAAAERDEELRRAREELEEERRRKAEMGRQEGGKSLYEVLQQNKSKSSEVLSWSLCNLPFS